MIRLEVEQGDARGRQLERETPEVTIGRAPQSDLVLPDWHVSGSHGSLVVDASTGALRFVDNRSTNGTRVNGMRVERAPLTDGCTIELGSFTLRFDTKSSPTSWAPDKIT